MKRNRRITVLALLALLGVMATLTAYAVPLYQAFCRITGYGGTTQVATARPSEILDRTVTVRFNADTGPALAWRFEPLQDVIEVKLGQPAMAYYGARSLAAETVTGFATFNVTPAKAGIYFNKTDCFCFTEQTLAAGAGARMAVAFFIDPALAKDRNLDDVTTITLSYTFFRAKRRQGAERPRAATNRRAGPAIARAPDQSAME